MANPTITTQYAGVSTKEILQLMVLGNQAFEQGAFNIMEDIDDKGIEITRMFVASNIVQNYQAIPSTPSNALTLTPRRMDPVKLMIYDHINPMEFQSYWKQFQQEGPLDDKILNPQIQAAIIDAYSKRSNNQLGRLVWQGNTTLGSADPLGKINGIVTRAISDLAAGNKSAATGVLTKANILAAFEALEAIITDELFEDEDGVYITSTKTLRIYKQAVIALTYKGNAPAGGVPAIYNEKKIVAFSGFTPDHIIYCKSSSDFSSNLLAAVNATDDADNLRIERWRPEGDIYFLKAQFSLDVNFGFAEEMFLSPKV